MVFANDDLIIELAHSCSLVNRAVISNNTACVQSLSNRGPKSYGSEDVPPLWLPARQHREIGRLYLGDD